MATGRGQDLVREWREPPGQHPARPRDRRDPGAARRRQPRRQTTGRARRTAPTGAVTRELNDASSRLISSAPCFSPPTSSAFRPRTSTLEKSRVLILPVPYERTVSYGVGTKNGPGAILEASHYVELYDDELDEEVYRIGVHTLPAWLPDDMEPAACVAGLEEVVAGLLRSPDRFVLTLGGEHSIAPGPIRGAPRAAPEDVGPPFRRARRPARRVRGAEELARLRRARRWVELGIPSVHVGIRSISREEVDYVRKSGTMIVSNREMHRSDAWMEKALARLTDEVYVTFDVDFFDGSLVPGTGHPGARRRDLRSGPRHPAAGRHARRDRRRRRRRARPGGRQPGPRLHDRQALLQAARVRFFPEKAANRCCRRGRRQAAGNTALRRQPCQQLADASTFRLPPPVQARELSPRACVLWG